MLAENMGFVRHFCHVRKTTVTGRIMLKLLERSCKTGGGRNTGKEELEEGSRPDSVNNKQSALRLPQLSDFL